MEQSEQARRVASDEMGGAGQRQSMRRLMRLRKERILF